jgi:hypothetical protein
MISILLHQFTSLISLLYLCACMCDREGPPIWHIRYMLDEVQP